MEKVYEYSDLYFSDPPTSLEINVAVDGRSSYAKAGQMKRLQCEAKGGNPLATIKWYKKGKFYSIFVLQHFSVYVSFNVALINCKNMLCIMIW